MIYKTYSDSLEVIRAVYTIYSLPCMIDMHLQTLNAA